MSLGFLNIFRRKKSAINDPAAAVILSSQSSTMSTQPLRTSSRWGSRSSNSNHNNGTQKKLSKRQLKKQMKKDRLAHFPSSEEWNSGNNNKMAPAPQSSLLLPPTNSESYYTGGTGSETPPPPPTSLSVWNTTNTDNSYDNDQKENGGFGDNGGIALPSFSKGSLGHQHQLRYQQQQQQQQQNNIQHDLYAKPALSMIAEERSPRNASPRNTSTTNTFDRTSPRKINAATSPKSPRFPTDEYDSLNTSYEQNDSGQLPSLSIGNRGGENINHNNHNNIVVPMSPMSGSKPPLTPNRLSLLGAGYVGKKNSSTHQFPVVSLHRKLITFVLFTC